MKIRGGLKIKIYMKTTHKDYCSHCKQKKPDIKYNFNKKRSIQYYYCNDCNTEKMRKYYKTDNGKLHVQKSVYKSIKSFKYKQDARILLNTAVLKGFLKRPRTCSKCKKEGRIEAHHNNYRKPLVVLWLCKKCHCGLHHKKVGITKDN